MWVWGLKKVNPALFWRAGGIMPITCSPYFFHWRCNCNGTEIRTNFASDKLKQSIWTVTRTVTWIAYPELVKTESRLTEGHNEWGDVELKRTCLASGGNIAIQLVKKLKWCQIGKGFPSCHTTVLTEKSSNSKWMGENLYVQQIHIWWKMAFFNVVEANLLWPYYLYCVF